MEELVLKAQKGDEQAFTDLILKFRHDLYKIAKMRLINDDDIDDAIQETMIVAFMQIKKLKDVEAFKPWIIKILINKCNKIYRKRKINQISYESNIENYINHESNNIDESSINFNYLIKNLSYEERMVLTLYYLEGYHIKEISKTLKMNENTVKTKLSRSKKKIKNNYKEEYIWT